ncbi:MAG: CusA/CzcA family heavy metal efflux RND transporter [Muribaculaceae bacterium]|nr:CusA/CzcA family heavy metal efflux RND transporter [Muribaculaceae bacterium]
MLNKIIGAALGNRVLVLVLSGVIAMLGVIMLMRTEVDIFPDLNAPTVVVMTEAGGLAPEEVEKLVTFPLETAVNGATGVRRVRSQSDTGFSVVWVEFDWDMDVYLARQIVAEKIASVTGSLPPGVGVPTLGPQSSILGEVMIIGMTSNSVDINTLRTIADQELRPRLLAIGGVSSVSVIGGDVTEYQVRLNPERMRHFGLSLDNVLDAMDGVNRNASGGVLYDYGNEYLVKGRINTRSLDEIGLTAVSADGRVLLRDIAVLEEGAQTPRIGAASVGAVPAVLLTVTKQPATGTIELTDKIDGEIAALASTLPDGIEFSTDIFRQSDFIDSSIGNLQSSLFEGAVMVIVVLFFFLMNVRTTVISLVALPMSILISVIILNLLGLTVNTMSLGGIAIAIGSLVDDAIVDVENVYKRLRENRERPVDQRKSTLRVVYQASAEVRMPIFNSSLIIVAAFLPLFFLTGIEGRMLIPLGVSFIVALVASTVVALTLTPALCSFLLGGKSDSADLDRESWTAVAMKRVYGKGLSWAMSHRKFVLAGVGVLFVIAIAVLPTLGRSFLPSFNEGSFTINVSTFPGISMEESDRLGREAEKLIMSVPEISKVARKTGRAELDEHSLGVNVSEIEAPYNLDSGRSRGDVVRELRAKLSTLPGCNIEIGQPISHRIDAMLSGTNAQIAIKVFGNDLESLYDTGMRIKDLIMTVPGVVDATVEQQTDRPQVDLKPRRELMARYGITPGSLARAIETSMVGTTVGEIYVDNGLPRNITVRYEPDMVNSIDALKRVMIDSNSGMIPLSSVVDVVSATGPNTIRRENVSRRIVVSANVDGRDLRSTVNEIRDRVADNIDLPEGYYVQYGGQFESEASATRTLVWASALSLILITMLLYQEFKSVGQSLLILVNMPLAMIGGVLILKFTSGELNIPAIIGFISLLGITTRNGMLLVSRYNHLRDEKVGLMERIRRGSADRLNPIIMTALTSALALIPLALRGGQPGNEIQAPLAMVILGGLVSSTVLNIFVVPVMYYLINRKHESE